MVGDHWFVYPVEHGVELVIDSADPAVYDRALAAFVTHFTDYNLLAEWSMDGGEVMHFVPAPIDADDPAPDSAPQSAPVVSVVLPDGSDLRPHTPRPTGNSRRIPRQSDAA